MTACQSACHRRPGIAWDWDCAHGNERHSLKFISANQLRFDGEISSDMLRFIALVVEEEGGIVSYPFRLQGDSLTVTNPYASITRCSRERDVPGESATARAFSSIA
jgi:hypothetical protein